jgi:hypothetical protein
MQHCKSCSAFHGPWFASKVKAGSGLLLSCGRTKAEMLVHRLNEVLGACLNVGLHVVATVCDMASTMPRP